MPRVVAIIQARMGSSRLPGKVLLPILDRPMLRWVVERTQRANQIHEVVVATSTLAEDQAIADHCRAWGVSVFRGPAEDVLDRYAQAAHNQGAEWVVRITGDCPLIDPQVVDHVIQSFRQAGSVDYASNTLERTYPRGLDVEVFTVAALDRAEQEAQKPEEREHVTPYIWGSPQRFSLLSVRHGKDLSHLRLCVDEEPDLRLVRAIYQELGRTSKFFALEDVLRLMEIKPELSTWNRTVHQRKVSESGEEPWVP